MTKAEIVQALYSRVGGFSKKESADMVDLVFEMMKETLGRGEKIKISGFGNFVLRDKRQRPGRNPQTGEPIKISERRVLTFKASQILKQALNPKRGAAGATNGHPSSPPPPSASSPGSGGSGAGPASAPGSGSAPGSTTGSTSGSVSSGSGSSGSGSSGSGSSASASASAPGGSFEVKD
jgi:integration host factor subunit alpha